MPNIFLTTFLTTTLLLLTTQISAATLQVTVKDDTGAQLPDTVIYAVPTQGNKMELPKPPTSIEQKNKTFRPFVSAVPVGTTAYFPNRDGIGHHVYSFSATKPFMLPLSDAEQSSPVTFDKPGVVTIGCNIHDWMVAYVYVLETPYYAISNAQGNAVIEQLPPGQYHIHAWHPGIKNKKEAEQSVDINTEQTTALEISIEIKPEYFWRPEKPATEEQQY